MRIGDKKQTKNQTDKKTTRQIKRDDIGVEGLVTGLMSLAYKPNT